MNLLQMLLAMLRFFAAVTKEEEEREVGIIIMVNHNHTKNYKNKQIPLPHSFLAC